MAARRTVILIAAVVVAAIAAVAVYSYLTTVQDRANKDAKLVKVFVVKKDIAKGLPGEQALDQGYIKPDKINVKFRATTALTRSAGDAPFTGPPSHRAWQIICVM